MRPKIEPEEKLGKTDYEQTSPGVTINILKNLELSPKVTTR